MGLEDYAWLIYILTFLLTFAIIFITFLIVVKCIQVCAQMWILCCKHLRRDPTTNVNHNQNEYSSNDSSFFSDNSVNEQNVHRIIGDHSSIVLLDLGHDNSGFCFDRPKTMDKSIINRKYDDPTRFSQINHHSKLRENINMISNDLWSSMSREHFNNNLVSQYILTTCSASSQMSAHFILEAVSLNKNPHLTINCNLNVINSDDELSWFSSQNVSDHSHNLEDILSVKLDAENEIPPSYDQIINKESRV